MHPVRGRMAPSARVKETACVAGACATPQSPEAVTMVSSASVTTNTARGSRINYVEVEFQSFPNYLDFKVLQPNIFLYGLTDMQKYLSSLFSSSSKVFAIVVIFSDSSADQIYWPQLFMGLGAACRYLALIPEFVHKPPLSCNAGDVRLQSTAF